MHKLSLAWAAVAALSIAGPVGAATLIQEDFTSGLGAFTATGQVGINNGNGYIGCCGTTGSAASMSNNFVAFGSGNLPSGLISAPINLLAGQSYTLSFNYATLGQGSDTLTALLGGQTMTTTRTGNNNMDTTFQAFSFSWIAATGGPTALQFSSNGTINADAIVDNILLVGPAAPLPEPATWAMMLLGFGSIGLAVRKRGRKLVVA